MRTFLNLEGNFALLQGMLCSLEYTLRRIKVLGELRVGWWKRVGCDI